MNSIPVDVRNPGQVFACLGLMEVVEALLHPVFAGFSQDLATFKLALPCETPLPRIFDFVAEATISEAPSPGEDDRMARPLLFAHSHLTLPVGHWADRSGRETFKLYAGNRSAFSIAKDMQTLLCSVMADRDAFLCDPWNTLCPMGGSFNLDSRGAWNAMDAGFSPDAHHAPGGNVMASPAVQLLAAIGLQHARPQLQKRRVRYSIWKSLLSTSLARAALGGGLDLGGCLRYQFDLRMAGKNKIVAFAESEA